MLFGTSGLRAKHVFLCRRAGLYIPTSDRNPILVHCHVHSTASTSHFIEGTDRCSQNYEHPQHENENAAHITRSIARIWQFAQIVAAIDFRTVRVQVVDSYVPVFK